MKTKKRRKSAKKNRIIFSFIIFGTLISVLGYKFFYNINQITKIKEEKNNLNSKLVKLEEEEEILLSDIEKLKDPAYVAKYAREKYLYSKDGELIIRLPK